MLVSLLAEVELDEESLRDCLESGRYTDEVNADLAEGQALGIDGTPGFFVNGYPVSGAQPFAVFQQVIALAEEGRLAEAYQSQPAVNDPPQAGQPIAVPVSDEPAKGSPNAPVTIVEYSDYQCPFCLRHFQQTMPQLQAYIDAGQVRYLFKDFPLHTIHPQAQKAHESARCAREQGGDEAYWQMHNLLFANQEQWANNANHVALFKSFAAEMELTQTAFDECLDSGRYAEAVNAEVDEGVQLGVRGTPSFFINGQPLVGAQPFSVFQQAIETLLADEGS
jgi:protein-disulfide isomerase